VADKRRMRLLTAHKILIGSAVAFFAFFALFQIRSFAATGSLTDLGSGVIGLGVAVGFALYLRTVWSRRSPHEPQRHR
jgi:hypothetical protein